MFGSGYWYIEGGPGVRLCYAKSPTYICPHAYFERVRDADDKVTGRVPTAAAEKVAAVLGTDPESAAKLLERGHRSMGGRLRVDGKLTERCEGCGAKMQRKGFRIWREELVPEEERTSEQRTSAAINSRLGFDGQTWKTTYSGYVETKREAEGWARENAASSKAAVA